MLFVFFFLNALSDEGELVLVQLRSDRLQLDVFRNADVFGPDVSGKDLHAVPPVRLSFRFSRDGKCAVFLVNFDVQFLRFCWNRREVQACAPLRRLLRDRAATICLVRSVGQLAKDLVEKRLHVFVTKSEHFFMSLVCEETPLGLLFITQKLMIHFY